MKNALVNMKAIKSFYRGIEIAKTGEGALSLHKDMNISPLSSLSATMRNKVYSILFCFVRIMRGGGLQEARIIMGVTQLESGYITCEFDRINNEMLYWKKFKQRALCGRDQPMRRNLNGV